MTSKRKNTKVISALVAALLPYGVHAACNADITANAPDARYSVNGEIVTDNYTGLVWKRCPEGLSGATCTSGAALTFTWQAALQHVATVNGSPATLGLGSGDWRLPNRNELASLVERRCDQPAINATIFPATPSSSFWTSSPFTLNAAFAWRVGFDEGEESFLPKTSLFHVRLVKGGF